MFTVAHSPTILMKRSYKDDLNDTCLSCIACCSAEIEEKKCIHPYARLFEYKPALAWPQLSLHWNKL